MNAQSSDRPMTTRNARLNWLLWSCEVVLTVLVLAMLVAVSLPLAFFAFSAEDVDRVGMMLGLIVAAILVGVLVAMIGRLIRGRKQPLDAQRLHGGSVAIGGLAFVFMGVLGTMCIEQQFGDGALSEGTNVVMLPAALVAWMLHRLLFANLKQWTGVIDDRTFDERYRPAQHFVAALALLIVSGTGLLIGMGEPEDAPSVLHIAPLLGVLLFYKTTVTITARRIRKKLAAVEPTSAPKGGAA